MVSQDTVLGIIRQSDRCLTVMEIVDLINPPTYSRSACRSNIYNACTKLNKYGFIEKVSDGKTIKWGVSA